MTQERDPHQDTVSLILDAADRFGGPRADVTALPYADPSFDAAMRQAQPELKRRLGSHTALFAEDLLDEAASVSARVDDAKGRPRDVRGVLFALPVLGPRAAVERLCSPDGVRELGRLMGECGVAAKGTRLTFVPRALAPVTVRDASPGTVRRLAHCLAARVVPNFPAAPVHDTRVILGTAEGPVLRDDNVVRVIVGLRATTTRPGHEPAHDWFTTHGPSEQDGASAIQAAWSAAVDARYDPEDLLVGIPTTWVGGGCEATILEVIDAFDAEAQAIAPHLSDAMPQGVLHYLDRDEGPSVALLLPDGTVLGPVTAPGLQASGHLPMIAGDLGIGADVVRHDDPVGFSDFVVTGDVDAAMPDGDGWVDLRHAPSPTRH